MSNPEKRIKLEKFPNEISTNETDLNDINDIILELSVRYHDPNKNTVKISATELLLCTQVKVHTSKTAECMTLFEYIAKHEGKTDEFKEAIEFLRSLKNDGTFIECSICEYHDLPISLCTDYVKLILNDDRHPVLRLLHMFNYQLNIISAKHKRLQNFIEDLAENDPRVRDII